VALLDKLFASVSPNGTSIRPMGTALLASALVTASAFSHREADVEHLLDEWLRVVDIRKALEANGVFPDDAIAVVDQLLDERPVVENPVEAVRSPRLQAVHDLVARGGPSAAVVITSAAAALPRELVFLRKPLEHAAHDVAPLFDGALSAAGGQMTFTAWDATMRGCMVAMQKVVDEHTRPWFMTPLMLFATMLITKRYHPVVTASGIDVEAVIAGIAHERKGKRRPFRDPPAGRTAGIGPALFAVILRAEHYAARDASDVALRHVLRSLRDEPELASSVERVARVIAPDL
jgi:hypothetical protein